MNVKWTDPLKEGQRENPVVHYEYVELPQDFIYPTDAMLAEIFTGKGAQLKTWGRTPKVKENDPHWIGVKGSTPLHTDPAYPRYTHHLKIRVDDGIHCWGYNKSPLVLTRGLFYILDTHSPHQVYSKNSKDGWNVSISIDSKIQLDPASTIQQLINYGLTREFNQL
jgi:hypothetical protein